MFSRGSNSDASPVRDGKTPDDKAQQSAVPQTDGPVSSPPAETGSRASPPPRVSTIGPDLKIVGNLVCDGELHIEGRVDGDIHSKIISVKKGAQIEGALTAEEIIVDGAVIGQIKATTVIIARAARVLGDVLHKTLAVEAGAHLEGHCRQIDVASEGSGHPLKATVSRKRG